MKKLRGIAISFAVIILLLAGNYIYGCYMGYNVRGTNYLDGVISPDRHYAIEIQYKYFGLWEPDLIIVCKDLTTNEKVEYIIINIGMFSDDYKFEDIFHVKWYDNRAELTAWVEEDIITTYILDWETIFSS